jgi:hypothetical protein
VSVGRVAVADRRPVAAASLAALAESGLLFLPIRLLVVDEGGATEGPLATYPAFVALFTVSVAVATSFRHSTAMPSVAAVAAIAVGLGQSTVWGGGELAGSAFMVILALLAALRAVVLAHRDWRDPVAESFALGAMVLLVEVLLGAAGGDTGWEPYLPAVVVVFFVASLGSRAASVWVSGRRALDRGAGRRLRTAVLVIGGLGAALFLAALLGSPHGLLPRGGSLVIFLMGRMVYGIAFVLAWFLAAPIAWVVDRLGIDLNPVARAARALQGLVDRGPTQPGQGYPPLLRLLGFALLAAIGFLLFRAIRRYRELAGVGRSREGPAEPEPRLNAVHPRRRGGSRPGRLRRELPDDTVRRWYAEALLALEGLGLPKSPSRTPSEYLGAVTAAFPECAGAFTALTRAYEDVRYGSAVIARSALDRLGAHRRMAMDALGRAKRIDQEAR